MDPGCARRARKRALRFEDVLPKLPLARRRARSQATGQKAVKPMKIHIDMEMTPEEARKLMGLPDLTRMQEQMTAEMQKRMKAALDTSDPEAMLKAWMPVAAPGLEQFQRFLWDSAKAATAKKPSSKG
jgi:hypothetical protein